MVSVGETVIERPFPSNAPPQDPEYHSQVELVPREPPATFKTTKSPEQIDVSEAVIDVGSVEGVDKVTEVLTQLVTLQFPEAST